MKILDGQSDVFSSHSTLEDTRVEEVKQNNSQQKK